MRHKILLPTDFSKNSMQAINYARQLYKNDYCDFYLLNVFTSSGKILQSLLSMEPGSKIFETAKRNSENGLAKVFDMITMSDKHNPKHSFDVISTFNTIVDGINEVVAQKDIKMVIMGTKGQTNSILAAFGSTAVAVMENVRNCPVMVVPHDAKLALPKEIVFPTSYKTHYKKRELSYLTDIAKNFNADIAVLHISEEDELGKREKENKALLQEILKGTNYKFHYLSHDSVMAGVNIFVKSRNSDMVAFINKKHSFFENLLSNPMVKQIALQVEVPILTLHDLRN